MNSSILDIISKLVSDGITWQETIVTGLFFIASVLVIMFIVSGLVKIANLVCTTIQNAISILSVRGRNETRNRDQSR